MTKHIHAELMAQYAQDALETDEPQERWEFYDEKDGLWKGIFISPNWDPRTEYRRKPKPETKEPEYFHHYLNLPENGHVHGVDSIFEATHIGIYQKDGKGSHDWVYDVEIPNTLRELLANAEKISEAVRSLKR